MITAFWITTGFYAVVTLFTVVNLYILTNRVQKKYEDELWNRLLRDAAREGIVVSIVDDLGDSAGKITLFTTHEGAYIHPGGIKILRHFDMCPYLLAHELGHHYAMDKANDHSETGADREALSLVRRLTNRWERWVLRCGISAHLKGKEKRDGREDKSG